MSFEFNECFLPDGIKIEGLYEVIPQVFKDERGSFLEFYNEKAFFSAGLTARFVQDNNSSSVKGVLRGLHFQKENTQAKLIRTSIGKVYDVVVDLRNQSKSFGRFFGIILDSEKHNMLYIPKGFAHGFLVLSDYAETIYKCSDFYMPAAEAGIIWNDFELAVNWNDYYNSDKMIISAKDMKNPCFNKAQKYFDIDGNWIGM